MFVFVKKICLYLYLCFIYVFISISICITFVRCRLEEWALTEGERPLPEMFNRATTSNIQIYKTYGKYENMKYENVKFLILQQLWIDKYIKHIENMRIYNMKYENLNRAATSNI